MKSSILLSGLFMVSGAAALTAVGMQSNATGPFSSQAISETANDGSAAETVTLNVPDMVCEFACAPHVRKTLADVPGVDTVTTNVDQRTATITVAPHFEVDRALAKLEKAGYPATRAQ